MYNYFHKFIHNYFFQLWKYELFLTFQVQFIDTYIKLLANQWLFKILIFVILSFSSLGAVIIASGKFGSPAVKRNCHPCGMYNPDSWKRILSFNCLRNTIKMRCLRVPKRKQVNAFYRHVLWTPLGTRYVPRYSQPCSCSKVVSGQLRIIRPINQVLLSAYCLNASF